MNPSRDIALIDELRALPAETDWFEFKANNSDPDMIGKRCAALSNSARIDGRDTAYMVWGVEDGSHAVVGTDFNADLKKVGNQALALWLANSLQPSIAFTFRAVAHPQGRLVLLEIPAATGAPLVKPDRMIDLPPRSRNEAIASLMRRLGLCEEQGSGLDKVVQSCEVFQLPAPLFRAEGNATQAVLYGPRSFANMTPEERIRACHFHAVLKFLSGDKMKNASLCARLGIASRNAAQATAVINKTLEVGLIRVADPDHPRAGYVPHWA